MKKGLKIVYILCLIFMISNCKAKNENKANSELRDLMEQRSSYAHKIHKKRLKIVIDDIKSQKSSYKEIERESVEYLRNSKKNIKEIKVNSKAEKIHCKQYLTLPSGKSLTYNVKYGFYPQQGNFAYESYILENPPKTKARKIPKEKRLIGTIIESKEDIDKDKNNEIFEKYINKNLKTKNLEYKVLDYIKGNFTDSGKEEYIVFFTAPLTEKELATENFKKEYRYVKYIGCLILENDKVSKMYEISDISGPFTPSVNKITNFGKAFSLGWVADFNQNGKNEIFFDCLNYSEFNFFSVEFFDNKFIKIPITNHMWNIESVDWEKGEILIMGNTERPLKFSCSTMIKYFATYQWNEEEKCYILLSERQVRDSV